MSETVFCQQLSSAQLNTPLQTFHQIPNWTLLFREEIQELSWNTGKSKQQLKTQLSQLPCKASSLGWGWECLIVGTLHSQRDPAPCLRVLSSKAGSGSGKNVWREGVLTWPQPWGFAYSVTYPERSSASTQAAPLQRPLEVPTFLTWNHKILALEGIL